MPGYRLGEDGYQVGISDQTGLLTTAERDPTVETCVCGSSDRLRSTRARRGLDLGTGWSWRPSPHAPGPTRMFVVDQDGAVGIVDTHSWE